MRDSKTVSMPEMNMETDTDATLTSVCETLIRDAVIEHCEQIHDDNRAEALGTSVKYKERMQQLRVCATVEEERMREEILRRRKTQRHQSVMRGVRIAAMSMAAMLVLMVAAPAVQTYAKRYFENRKEIANYKDHISVTVDGTHGKFESLERIHFEPSYIPKGFVQTKQEGFDGVFKSYMYENEQEQYLNVNYYASDGALSINYDNEHHDIYKVMKGETEILVGASTNSEYDNFWIWEDGGYTFLINGYVELFEIEKIYDGLGN